VHFFALVPRGVFLQISFGPPLHFFKPFKIIFRILFGFFIRFVIIMVRKKLVESLKEVNFAGLRLKHLSKFEVNDAVEFLANVGALKNEISCDKCGSKMNVQKRTDSQDGIRVNI
jgi:hypothetical protein